MSISESVDRVYEWSGHLYVPFSSVPLSAGPFLPATPHCIREHVELAPTFRYGVRDYFEGGFLRPRPGLAAAKVHGDSMIGKEIFHGDIVLFQCEDFGQLDNARMVIIEKIGEEEGYGAWALKKLVLEKQRSWRRDECGDEQDWNDPIVKLQSYNSRVSPWPLDPSGQYRVRGVFRRTVSPDKVHFVDSEVIRRRVTGLG